MSEPYNKAQLAIELTQVLEKHVRIGELSSIEILGTLALFMIDMSKTVGEYRDGKGA